MKHYVNKQWLTTNHKEYVRNKISEDISLRLSIPFVLRSKRHFAFHSPHFSGPNPPSNQSS